MHQAIGKSLCGLTCSVKGGLRKPKRHSFGTITPLHLAASTNNTNHAEVLLIRGANPNAVDARKLSRGSCHHPRAFRKSSSMGKIPCISTILATRFSEV